MKIANVLAQVFRPGAVEAQRAAKALLAVPSDQVKRDMGALLMGIENARSYSLGLHTPASFAGRETLQRFLAKDHFDAASAQALIRACRAIKQDLGSQFLLARRDVGEVGSWARQRHRVAQNLHDLARSLQHFRPTKAE